MKKQKVIFVILFYSVLNVNYSIAQWVQTNGPYGGSVKCLAISNDLTKLYAASYGGGIFKSTDEGISWQNIGLYHTDARSMAINPSGEIIFVGSEAGGHGIAVSPDGGITWEFRNNGLLSDCVNEIIVSPDGEKVIAATSLGVHFTENNGSTWVVRNNGLINTEILSLAINRNGERILAGDSQGNIYVTVDYGETWSKISENLPVDQIQSIAIGENDSNVLAGIYEDGVYLSTDGGINWTRIRQVNGTVFSVLFMNHDEKIYAGSWHQGVLMTDDKGINWQHINPEVSNIFDMLKYQDESTILVASHSKGVFKSTNSGIDWTEINEGLISTVTLNLDFSNEGNLIIAANDGAGIFLSTDKGNSWKKSNTGLTGKNIRVVKANPMSTDIYAGTGWNGMFRSSNNGVSWSEMNNGIGNNDQITAIGVSPDGKNIFIGNMGNTSNLSPNYGQGQGIYRSTDHGLWTYLGLSQYKINAFEFTQDGSLILVGTNEGGVFRSSDNGESWSTINNDLDNLSIHCLESSQDGRIFFAGTWGAGMERWYIRDEYWNTMNNGMSYFCIVSLALTSDGSKLFEAVSGDGVYVSTNYGSSWRNVSEGLIKNDFYSMFMDHEEETLYLCTREGVWKRSISEIVNLESQYEIQTEFNLKQNYPNPFNPITNISYVIPKECHVTLKVYDLLGRQLGLLIDRDQPAGQYEIQYDAGSLASGVYFYTMQAGNFIKSKKFLLMK